MMKINRKDKRPIWQQLLDQAIHNITSGVWAPGELLIPSRELAHILGVSRSTIQLVYEELLSRGYTVTSRRGGTRVAKWKQMTETTHENENKTEGISPPEFPLLNSSVNQLHDWFRSNQKHKVAIDFTPHEPYIDEKFQKNWRQSLLHASAAMELSNWAYGDPYGFLPLRQQIQRYLSLERGIHVHSDQILLTSGAQHSIDLIAQTLLAKGDTVSVEDPGFPVAWMALKYRGMNVTPVPVDEYGLVADQIEPNSKLIYTTPSHQCAIGVVMSEPRRQHLIYKAAQDKCWIIEDDYDSEFRYRGEPLPTLFSQAPQHTLYLMSFSKMIAPAIRISVIVGPTEVIAQLAKLQQLLYRHLPIMDQLTLTHFIQHGHFMRHMRRVRNVYRRRHENMTKAIIANGIGERFTLSGVETGLHMFLEAEAAYDEETATRLALQQGIAVYPLQPYCLASNRKGWVLGFAKVDEALIEEGIHRFGSLIL
jgi:GntR family transcriptional regulator/MocR family aminotransferase